MMARLSGKQFIEKLHRCLDETGAPVHARERAAILSKLLDIPKHHAWAILQGHLPPDQSLLEQIAQEFEVDLQWLVGMSK